MYLIFVKSTKNAHIAFLDDVIKDHPNWHVIGTAGGKKPNGTHEGEVIIAESLWIEPALIDKTARDAFGDDLIDIRPMP
jgi:hypothetical protein